MKLFLLFAISISTIVAFKYFKKFTSGRRSLNYYTYKDSELMADVIETFKGTEKECITSCEMQNECQSLNYKSQEQSCQLLKNTGYPVASLGNKHITKIPKTCPKFCHNYGAKRLCGNCKCVEKCGAKLPYACDCREVQTEVVSCEEALFQQSVSGIYKIKPGESSFDVLCVNKEGKHWTMYMTTFNSTSSFPSTYEKFENFDGSFTENFWIGLKSLYEMTNSKAMVLRLEFITQSFKTVILEYTGFQLLDDTNYRMFYNTYRVVTGEEADIVDHMKCRQYQPFIVCAEEKGAWWGNCKDNVPILKNEIKWNLNEKIIQMKMLLRNTEKCESLEGRYMYNNNEQLVTKNRNLVSGRYPLGDPYSGYIDESSSISNMKCDVINSIERGFSYTENECKILWKNGKQLRRKSCCMNFFLYLFL